MTVDPNEVRAIIDKVKAELPGHTWQSATVTRAVSDAGFSSVVELVLDGDTTETVIQATNLTATPMTGGVRVKVVFDPPQGVYVLGVLQVNAVPVARLECAQVIEEEAVSWSCDRVVDGGMQTDGTRLIFPLNGLASVTCRIGTGPLAGGFQISVYDSAGTFLSPADFGGHDGISPLLMGADVVPVLAGGWMQVEAGSGAGIATNVLGHFAAHYIASYQDNGPCSCSGG